jgi:hypothetical protein
MYFAIRNHLLTIGILTLSRLRMRYPEYFGRVDVFYSVMQMLGCYHFRFAVRSYILDAFDLRFTTDNMKELDDVQASSSVVAPVEEIDSSAAETEEAEQGKNEEDAETDIPKPKLHPSVIIVGGFQDN